MTDHYKTIEDALNAIPEYSPHFESLKAQALAALRELQAQQITVANAVSEQPKKLQVTLDDRPIDAELAKYKRMFEAACVALGSINEALGLDPEDGGAGPILDAIAELKTEHSQALGEAAELLGVPETLASGEGFWRSCTGCYETNEGHPPNGAYFSKVFGCYIGHGCSECGGIGAIWDDTDYEAMADFMNEADHQPIKLQARKPLTPQQRKERCEKHRWIHGSQFEEAYNLGISDAEAAHGIKEQAQGDAVYLVATGEVYEGQETYTRHDVMPPLCEAEKLFIHPQPTEPQSQVVAEPLYRAVINCPHEIDHDQIILSFDPKQPGHNALNQLGRRLDAALQVQPQTQGDAAIKTLVGMGYTYHGGELWKPPLGKPPRFLDEDPPQNKFFGMDVVIDPSMPPDHIKLVQPQARKPLTDDLIDQLADRHTPNTETGALNYRTFARAIEAAHGIKE